jgi:ATP-dependent exoDNAse (exonuclease V) alpha subunit
MAIMALYHLSAQIIGRSNGRSSVAAAAYRSGQALTDARTGTECRYDRRRERVVHTEILAPAGSPAWATDRASLWNAVERGEKRKDAQLAREFEVALPVELTEQQRLELVRDWTRAQLVSHGLVVDISHHRDRADRNPHVHMMTTMRAIDGNGFGPKLRDLNRAEQLEQWRSSWAEACNSALARAGHQARVDHRSLEAQGIDREPTIHEGHAAREIAQRGQESDRAATNRAIRQRNAHRAAMADQAERLRKAVAAVGDFIRKIGAGLLARLAQEIETSLPITTHAPTTRQMSSAIEEKRPPRMTMAKPAGVPSPPPAQEAQPGRMTPAPTTRQMSPAIEEKRPQAKPAETPSPPPAPEAQPGGMTATQIANLHKNSAKSR